MTTYLEAQIKNLIDSGGNRLLSGGFRGIEKESLRITKDGQIAQSPHPKAWGASLTHPFITTDYSEALPELITPPSSNSKKSLSFLHELHHFLYEYMEEDELLWAASMPCAVSDDKNIPIAQYGNSNVGKMKHIYRLGLDYRYGRRMQAIAGVHFNYSLPEHFWPIFKEYSQKDSFKTLTDFKNGSYFGMIRNYLRLGWIIPLLFGSSPVVCKSFLAGNTARFKKLFKGTYYVPNGTSLRMSDIGYKNKNQAALKISYDGLNSYIASLEGAINSPYPEYEAIGLYEGRKRIQLSTNVLQIENEYYSSIRPKRTDDSGQRPSKSLNNKGVEYVEMRALDVDALNPYGVSLECLLFCEAFLIFCLLENSPLVSEKELESIEYNEITVALRGREANLKLHKGQQDKWHYSKDWILEIFDKMRPICQFLEEDGSSDYSRALEKFRDTVVHPDTLPSAKILQLLVEENQEFHSFALDLSKKHRSTLKNGQLSKQRRQELKKISADSFSNLELLERTTTTSLEEYINDYLID